MTLPQLDDIVRARSVRNFARLRQVDEARKRNVGAVQAPDCVDRRGEERDHEDDEEERLADGEEACATGGGELAGLREPVGCSRTEHENLEDEQTESHAIVGERPCLSAALVGAVWR